jgi:Arc/MetJ family transcription regulator
MATAKTSLTLDKALLAEARQRVGRRSLSRYVNVALRHQLQRDRLAELLNELERQAGAIEPGVMEEVRRAWPAPESRNA